MNKLPNVGFTERQLTDAVNGLIDGRGNAVGSVTLRASNTTTVVDKPTINANAAVFLFPASASAAASVATTYANITPGGGSFTITHTSDAATDRTFHYLVNGG